MSEQVKNNKVETTPEYVEMDVVAGEGIRRLPVYLLLDTSGSMVGAPIEDVRRGVEQFKREIQEDIFSRETVYVGVIKFGGELVIDYHGRGFLTKNKRRMNLYG